MIARRLVTRTASTGLYYGFLAFVTLAALGPIIWVMVSLAQDQPADPLERGLPAAPVHDLRLQERLQCRFISRPLC